MSTSIVALLRTSAAVGAVWCLSLLSGCASSRPDLSGCVYPAPPDTARYALVNVLRGADDFDRSVFDVLFGKRAGGSFVKPFGVAFDTSGNIAVADAFAGGVVYIDMKAQRIRSLTNENFQLPLNLTYDSKNILYIADGKAKRIWVMNDQGELIGKIGAPGQLLNPVDVAVDEPRGRVYVADSYKHAIMVYTMKGDSIGMIGSRGDSTMQFNYPTNIALNAHGDLYVVDAMNFRVQVISPEGTFVRMFGSVGDGFGQFTRPRGIAIDQEGRVYVADAAFNNFQVFTAEGQLLTFVGHSGARPGEFNQPAGIAFDGKDEFAVVDQINRRIQVFKALAVK